MHLYEFADDLQRSLSVATLSNHAPNRRITLAVENTNSKSLWTPSKPAALTSPQNTIPPKSPNRFAKARQPAPVTLQVKTRKLATSQTIITTENLRPEVVHTAVKTVAR